MKSDFDGQRRTNSKLTAQEFLRNKSGHRGLMFIKSDGWERPALDTTLNKPERNLGFHWNSSTIGTLLGEDDYVDLDQRFSRWPPDNDERGGFYSSSGAYSETSYSKWLALDKRHGEDKAEVSVILIRENKKPDPQDRAYFTGGPGGVRGFALSIGEKTLDAYLNSENAVNIGR